jgi:hypothetical protein
LILLFCNLLNEGIDVGGDGNGGVEDLLIGWTAITHLCIFTGHLDPTTVGFHDFQISLLLTWFNFPATSSFQVIRGKGIFHCSDLEQPAEFA